MNYPANDSELATHIISMLLVHKSYIFKLCLQLFQTQIILLEKRWNFFKTLNGVQVLTEIKLWITMTWMDESPHRQHEIKMRVRQVELDMKLEERALIQTRSSNETTVITSHEQYKNKECMCVLIFDSLSF